MARVVTEDNNQVTMIIGIPLIKNLKKTGYLLEVQ